MLRAEENEILTRVDQGTLMGELLRRYWTPACLTAEVPESGGAPTRVGRRSVPSTRAPAMTPPSARPSGSTDEILLASSVTVATLGI
jgi:hypothetical protein